MMRKILLLANLLIITLSFSQTKTISFSELKFKKDVNQQEKIMPLPLGKQRAGAFTQRLDAGGINVRGNMTFIGNNNLNRDLKRTRDYYQAISSDYEFISWDGSNYQFNNDDDGPNVAYDSNLLLYDTAFGWAYNMNNGHFYMDYVDVDGFVDEDGDTLDDTFSSSTSDLNLPTCSKVVYAGLYWVGVYPTEFWEDASIARSDDYDKIKFKLPSSNYIDITADDIIYNTNEPYICFKDVTSLIDVDNANGTYAGANIRAIRGRSGGLGGASGWTMIVVYENDNDSSKNISIFDGFATIQPAVYDSSGNITTPAIEEEIMFSGFTTIDVGPVKVEQIVGALEGDGFITGDNYLIKDQTNNFVNVYNTLSPEDNFFNGSLTVFDTYLAGRTPDSENTLGLDVDHIEIDNTSNSIIGNSQTEAEIKFTTDGDVYWPFLNAISVEIIEPKIKLIKTVHDAAGVIIPTNTAVNLGSELFYNLSFESVGTDNALSTEIIDQLPKNVDLIEADLVLPASPDPTDPITYTYDPPVAGNGFRGVITFSIPDIMVEMGRPAYTINLKVKVVATCNDLRDVCSNEIENQAFANYSRDISANNDPSDDPDYDRIENTPSFSGVDACNLGQAGTSNFLVDISGCTFDRTEVMCTASLDLTAGNGFLSYSWENTNNPGIEIGANQTLNVTAAGTYSVIKTAPVGCISSTETITVVDFNSSPNPVISFVDQTYPVCNGFELSEIYLCGVGDSREIRLPFTAPTTTTVRWFKLDETVACSTPVTGCANVDIACTWTDEGTDINKTFTDVGQYRLEVLYDGRCPKSYYFNVFKATLSPDIVKENLECGNSADITINNIPNGYQYSLTGPGGFNAPYQDDNTFTVTQPGDYSLTIRLDNPTAASCEYTFPLINIQEVDIDLDVLITTMLCANENADIRVQVNNVAGPYTYTLTEGGSVIGTQGPIADNDYTFNVTSGGNYVVTVTTPNCTDAKNVFIDEPEELTITPVLTKDISCLNAASNGIIDLSSTGGNLTGSDTYTYAVWSGPAIGGSPYTTIADIPSGMYSNNDSNFTTTTTYSIPNGSEGTYTFVVIDSNNCYTISQPVEVVVEAELSFNHSATPLVCSTDTNGIINVSVNGDTLGFNPIEYSIDGGTTWSTTGVFNNLAANTYTISIRASKPNYQCNYEITGVEVEAPDPIFGEVELEREFRCTAGAKVKFFNVTGGTITSDYTYGVDSGDGNGVVYYTQSSSVFNSFSPGTYTFYIRDNNGCEYQIPTPVVIVPLDDAPIITPTIEYNCDGTGNVTLSPTKGSYEYSLDGGATTKDDTFDNLSVGLHTITVFYGRQCSIDVNFQIATGQEFMASITGSTNSTCNNADDGTITINATNYGGVSYDYSIDGGANYITTTTNPVIITGLDNITHDIRVTATVGNLTCPLDLGTITLTEPTTVTVSANITKEASCAVPTGATIEAVALGGTPPYQYSIDAGATWQASGIFTDVAASGTAYTIISQDSRNCASTTNATVTVTAPDTVAHTAVATQCYDGSNGEIVVTVTGGNGNYQFSLDGGPWQTPTPTTATTYTFTGLTPATYTVDVRDDFGCVSTQTSHTINQQLAVTTTLASATCNPGSITINATGGDSSYVYAVVSTGTGVTAGDFSATNPVTVAAGTWDVYVRDNNGAVNYCEETTTVDVQQITDPTITTSVVQPNCSGDTGDVNIVIANGVAPFTAVINSTTTAFTSTQGPVNTNNISFTGLVSDTYEIVITDANNCVTATSTETVAAPNALSGTASITQTYTCLQQGVITFATPTGGTAPFLYGIDGVFSNDPIKPNLTDGTYALVIRDANNCEFTLTSITIDVLPTAPTLGSSIAYNCDGTGNVTITPLVGTYTYSLDGGADQASNIFNNVAVGAHTITVDYGSSCTIDISVDVATGQEFMASITGSTNSTCNNADDGTITINATNYGGVSYDYSIDGGANYITTTTNPVIITGLDNITHDIRVTATVGNLTCPLDLGTITLTEPTTVTVSANITKEASCAVPTGATIEAVALGGTPPYQYSIDAGATWQASGIFTDVAASGTAYTIISQDSRNCASTTNATVTVTAPDTVAHTAVATQCYDGSNGEIVVTVTGGNGNYQFSLDGGPWQTPTPTTATTYTFTGLTPATYTVDVRDDFGCVSTQTSHTINQQLAVTTTLASATCNPGSITINATGGDSSYVYAVVSTGTGVTAGDFSATNPVTVAAGTWDVYVRDNNGAVNYCEETTTVDVQQITDPTITTSVVQPNCSGDTGDVNIVIANGVAPFTAVINSTTTAFTSTQGPVNTNNISFTGLVSDTYEIVITDANNCVTATSTETVAAPNALSGTASITQTYTCLQQGVITFATPTGGTAPFLYGIDGVFSNDPIKPNLTDGTYALVIRDANNCEFTLTSITIDVLPTAPTLGSSIAYNCDGTGNVTITPLVGTYTYSLDGGADQASNIFNNVAVGAHTITVDYGSSCTIDISVDVATGQEFMASITGSTNSTCNNADDGTITINATNYGGVSYDYSIDGGANYITTTTNPVIITGLDNITHDIRVTATVGNLTCPLDLGTITLTEPTTVTVSANITKEASCAVPTGATIEAVALGGTPPYQYSIDAGATWQASGIFTDVAASGTAYTIISQDSRNCASTTNATVTVTAPDTVAHTAVATQCYDGSNGEIVVTVTGGNGNYQFSLDGGPWQTPTPTTATTYTFTGLTPATYTVDVRDDFGCVSTQTSHTINQQLAVTTTLASATCNPGSITINATGGDSSYVYAVVSTGTGVTAGDFSATNPVTVAAGTWDVYVRDNNGAVNYCEETTTVDVQQITDPTITTSVVQPNCSGDTGTINVVVTDGAAPYTVTVNGLAPVSTTQQGPLNTLNYSFTGLVANTYEISVSDVNGCVTATSTETIAAPNALTGGSAAATALECDPAGGTILGTISFTAPTGGTTGYTYFYRLNGDPTFIQVTGTTVSNLAAGLYNTKVEDANGCELLLNDVTIVALPVVPALTASVAYNCDGTGNITITPPVGTYTYSLDGATAQASNVFNDAAVGAHTITVDYGSNCTVDVAINVEPNNAFDVSITASTGNSCNNSSDGTITIEAINIVGNFDYSTDNGATWNTTVSNPFTITGLASGSYDVQVRPDNASPAACTLTLPNVILANPTVVSVAAAITKEASCAAPTGATITATPTGGTAPYRYNIDGGAWQTSPVFTGVAASGTAYTVNIEDANNCPSSITIMVNAPLAVAFDVVPEVCYDTTNGELVVTVTQGGGNYQFSLDGGPFQASATNTYTFTGLTNGTYSVTVQDGLGCDTTTNNHTINDQLLATATVTDASCNTGEILVNATGGAGSYVFSLTAANAGVPADGTFNNTNLILTGAGTYDVYVRDNNGATEYCEFLIEDVVVNLVPDVAITVTDNQPTCNGDTGSLDVQINAGTGQSPHTIIVTNGSGYSNTVNNFGGTDISFNNLVAETYTITITDVLGCSDTEIVTLTDPQLLTATIDPIVPVCGTDFGTFPSLFGFEFNAASLPIVAPYTLEFSKDNGITWQTSPVFTGINLGTEVYPVIRILDTDGITVRCLTTLAPYEIPFNVSGLIVDPVSTPGNCSVGFTVTVEAINGVGPYEFAINSPSGWVGPTVLGGNTAIFTGLTPGLSYDFYVRDATLCIEKNNEDLYADFTPTVPITSVVDNQSCFGGTSGQITFSIDNTSTDLNNNFTWTLYERDAVTNVGSPVSAAYTNVAQTGFANVVVTGLGAGTYYLLLTNTTGGPPVCNFGSTDVDILGGTQISGSLTKVNDITCDVDGLVRIENVVGGFGTYTYTYTVSNATGVLSGNTITVDDATITSSPIIVEAFAQDVNGCGPVSLGTVTLNVSPSPTIVSAIPSSCDVNKTITITASNGTAPYQYSTDGGTTYSATTANTTYLAEGLTPATYNVIVRDANGCTSAISVVDIQDAVDFTLTQTKNIDCSATPESAVDINVTSGSANYEYEITGAVTVARVALPSNPFTFNPATAGTYTVTIYDLAETPNCSVTKSITIAARVEPNFTATATVNDICDAASTGEITVTTIDNGILPLDYTISLDPNGVGTVSSTGNVVFTNLPAGNYTIRGTSTINDCFTEQVVEIRDLDPIVPSIPDVTEFACTTGNTPDSATVTLPAGTVGGSGTYTRVVFQYTPASGAVENQDSASLSFTTTNTSGGPVTITVFDDSGCSSAVVNTAITALDALSNATVTVDNVITCNTGEDITVNYTATLGTAVNITIEGINGNAYAAVTQNGVTSGDFDSLPTGDYKITITHPTTGCILETFHTVGDAIQFDLLIASIKDESCKDAENGKVVLEFNAATPYVGQYDFALYDAGTNAVVDITGTGLNIPHLGVTAPTDVHNLPSGTYYIIATLNSAPSAGCTAQTANFTIAEPDFELDVTAVVNPLVSCATSSDATITATATGGWGSYVYQLELVAPAGTIVGTYDFATNGNNNIFTNIPAGDYKVIVRDKDAQGDLINVAEAISCRRTEFPVSIADPDPVTFMVSEDDNSCDTSSGGSITINASGGTGTYVYSLSVGGTEVASETLTAVTHTFTNLGANVYVVNVVDSNGCPAGATQNVTISPTLDFSVTETKKLDCSLTPAAEVSLEVLSGSGTYEYEIAGPSVTVVGQIAIPGNPFTFNPTVAGTYTVTIYDVGATGTCSIDKTIVIQPELRPDFTAIATTDFICNGDATGVIQLSANDNGILPLGYTILPNLGAFDATTNTFTGLPAGVYTITATGTNSCTTDRVVTISENGTVDVSAAITIAEFGCTTGNTTNNATITVDAGAITGGTGNFIRVEFIDNGTATVLQDSGSFVYTSTNEAGGNYTINVYDDKGCLGTTIRDIQPFEKLLDATITVTKAIDCATGEDITVKINPDITSARYIIIGANTGFTATQVVPVATDSAVFTNLATDDYTITITHPVTGCVFTTTHVVSAAPTFTLDIDNIQNVSCFGDASGSSELIFSTSTPYTGNYTYEIFNVGGVTTGITGNGVGNVSESLTGLVAGNYYVSVTMTGSPFCPVQSPDFTIEGPTAALGVTAVINPPVSCNGGADGIITATGVNGWGSYEYQLEFLAGGVVGTYTYSANNVFTNIAPDSYIVRVRDANGCISTTPVNVVDPTPVSFTVSEDDNSCDTSSGGSITINASGGTGTYVYSLSVGGTEVASETLTAVTHTFTNLGANIYVVNVVDSNGCPAGATQNVTISPTLDFSVTETKKLDCSVTPAAEVSLEVLSGSGTYQYEVVGAVSGTLVAQTAMATNPLVFNPTVADTYTVTVFDSGATPVCSIVKTIVIQSELLPDFTAVATTNDICNGDSTGVIQLSANDNGILPLGYTILPNLGAFDATTNTFTGLPAGVYTITATGTNSCTTDRVVTISENATVDVSAAITIAEFGCTTGNTTNNATITVDAGAITGGTGNFIRVEFIDNGTATVLQDSGSFVYTSTNEAGGNYTINVYDDKGCLGTTIRDIQPFEKLLDATITVTKAIDCATGEDITVKINPDITSARYIIIGANTGFTATQVVPVATDSAVFTNLATDDYTITITHPVTGCVFTTTHVVSAAPTFTLDIDNIQNVSCFGDASGSSELIFSTSTPYTGNYTYEIFNVGGVTTGITGNGVGNVSESLTGLVAGNYYVSVTMTGSPFCPVQSPDFTIEGPTAALGVTAVINPPVSCNGGADGIITATGVNGWGSYEYQLEFLAGGVVGTYTYSANNVFTNIAPDSYIVRVRDANGCISTTPVNVVDPTPVSFTVSEDDNSCDTSSGGSITINASGGTGTYVYSLSVGGTEVASETLTAVTHTFTNLGANIYVVNVVDSNGCPAGATQNVTISPTLDFSVTETKKLDCSVTPAAEVSLEVLSGSGTYQYEVVGAVSGTLVAQTAMATNPLVFNPTVADTYTVTVFDSGATPVCSIVKTIVIQSELLPDFTAVATTNDICNGDSTGVIQLSANDNGILPLGYTILPNLGAFDATTNTFTGLPAGVYTITATGTNSCTTDRVVTISENATVDVSAAITIAEFGCTTGNTTNNATITVDAGAITGGTGNFIRVEFIDNGTATVLQDSGSFVYTSTNEAGGNYTINVYDDKGCLGTTIRDIQPFEKLLDATITVTKAIDCATGEDITVKINPDITSARYIIIGANTGFTATQVVPVATDSAVFTNLATDDYTITITHPVTGCVFTTTHVVSAAPTFTLDIDNIQNVSCFGDASGSSELIFSTSTPYTGNYTYEIFNVGGVTTGITGNGVGNVSESLTGLVAGNYYVSVTMTGSPFCPVQSPDFTIEGPTAALGVTAVINPPVSCNGGADGIITATGVNGWGSYEYQLEFLAGGVVGTYTYSANNVFTNIAPDSYIVRVRDANGCISTTPVNVVDPTPVSFTVSEDDNSCDTSSGGSITINASGGTGTYVYSLSVGGTEVASETLTAVTHTFTNLGANIYVVNVVDSNGCPAGATQNVTISPTLDFSVTETKKLDCSVTPAAEVSLEVLSGSGTYQYEVVGAVSGTLVAQTAMATNPLVFNPTVADTYTVTVFDSGATPVCSIVKTIVIQSELLPDFTAVATTNDICNGDSTGVIQLSANDNGILPLGYTILPNLGAFDATTNTFTGLPAGVYTITATGTNSCTTDRVVTISENATVDVSAAITIAEFGCTTGNTTNNATITVDAGAITGGTGNFIRVEFIDNGTATVLQDSGSFVYTSTNEAGGNYTINVYDDKGCLGTTIRDIQPFEKLLDATITVTKAIDCATGEDITVKINPDITSARYIIIGANTGFTATQVVPVATDSAVFTNLATDDYTITITHPVTGCVFTTTHVVSAAPTFTLDIDNIQNVSCFGDASGSSELIFSTSTPYTGNYTYEIFNVGGVTTGITGNGVGNVSESLTGLVAGNYYVSVTMTGSPFCPVQSPDFTIEGPTAALGINATPSFISCITNDSGEVILSATGGWSSYEYQLVNTTTGTTFQTFNVNTTITGLTAGQYEATVRDGNNCIEVTNFELLDPMAITAGFNIVPNDCEGEFTASIEMINVVGGQTQVPNLNYSYVLVYPNGTQSASQTSNIFGFLGVGSYEVLISDGYSCQARIEPIIIRDPAECSATANITADITCDRPEAIVEVTGAGGTGTYMYSVDGTTNFVASNIFNVTAGPHVFYVRDTSGCISDPYTITVDDYETLVPTLNVISGHVTCNGDANGVLSAIAVGGLNNYEYQLLDASSIPYTPIGALQSSNMFTDLIAGMYAIRVHTTNAAGDVCAEDTAPHTITEPEVIVLTEAHTDVNCFGGDDGTITITPTGGNGTVPQDYEYNISTESPSKFVTNNVFEHLAVGTYIITVKDKVGCIETIEVEIEEPEALTITLASIVEQTCLNDPTPTITVDVQGGTAALLY